MKKEASRKNKLWLWLALGAAVLAVMAGVVLALVLGGGESAKPHNTGRPDLYWNIDREFYTANAEIADVSTREPAEDGMYYVRFAHEGQQKELPVADKRLVNFIDTLDVMGLVLDKDGVVVDAIDPLEVATEIGFEIYVRYVEDGIIYTDSSIAINGMKAEIPVTEQTGIYDVRTDAQTPGQTIDMTQLQPLDMITIYADENNQATHVYLVSRSEAGRLYWRTEQLYNYTLKETKRVPDEDGVYSIDFFCEGEIVTLKCKDKALVSAIDYRSYLCPDFCFRFDEEGYIVENIATGVGTKTSYACRRMVVTEVNGSSFTCENQFVLGDTPATYVGTLGADTIIYDASLVAQAEGRWGKAVDALKVGDNVTVWADTRGQIKTIYIGESLCGGPMYYSVTRKYDSTVKETSRTPNAEGWYEVELMSEGVVKTYKTKDKALMSQLDYYDGKVFGLKVNGDIIEYVYHYRCLFGNTAHCSNYYVTGISGLIFVSENATATTSKNGLLSTDCKIYNVSGTGEYGEETKLQVDDRIIALRDPTGTVVCILITARVEEGVDIYWNIARKYNSKTKETSRKPNEEGWYVFDVCVNGKKTTVKTKSKSLATEIDALNPAVMALKVSGDVVLDVMDIKNAIPGGTKRCNLGYVTSIGADGAFEVWYKSAQRSAAFTLAEDCKIYNVSNVFTDHQGEKVSSIKLDDGILCISDRSGNIVTILIRERKVDGLYWNTKQMYDSKALQTTRKPDADGWYVFELAYEGGVKTLKTKDKDIATAVDANSEAFTLVTEGNVIRSVGAITNERNVAGKGNNNWDVVSVDGNKVTMRYNIPGSTLTGETREITLADNCKIFDVSPTAETFGKAVKLQVGDRFRTYVNAEKEVTYIYIKYHNTREEGVVSLCDICGKEVYWNPWNGGTFTAGDGHYYVAEDTIMTSGRNVGNVDVDMEVTLDLNGKKLTGGEGLNTMFAALRGDTFNIMDSVGGGELISAGGNVGGVVSISGGATFNLYSGKLTMMENAAAIRGGIIGLSGEDSVFNMYGGTVSGGKVKVNDVGSGATGGNVYVYQGVFNMYGGTIENGFSASSGGNIYIATNGSFYMYGGTVTGGTCEKNYGGNIFCSTNTVFSITDGTISGGSSLQSGGNIALSGCDATISGGTVIGGDVVKYGGNIYMSEGSLTVSGGTVSAGHAGNYGGNIYIAGDCLTISGGEIIGGVADTYGGNVFVNSAKACDIAISGGNVDGDMRFNSAKSLTVSGAPVISDNEGGLYIPNGELIALGALADGAQIYIRSSGVFTEPSENAQLYAEKGYFKTADSTRQVAVKDGALAMVKKSLQELYGNVYEQAVQMRADGTFSSGGTVTAVCPYCGEEAAWEPMPVSQGSVVAEQVELFSTAHYYLDENTDYTQNTQRYKVQGGTVCLHLNGQTMSAATRTFWVCREGSYSAGIVNVMGDGTIASAGDGATRGAAFDLSDGTVNIFGGTYETTNPDQAIITVRNGQVNMFDGTVKGAEGNTQPSVYVTGAKSGFTMYGGTVEGSPCNISVTGSDATFNMQGGTVDGGVQISTNANVSISGDSRIGNANSGLQLAAGVRLGLGEMTENTQIYVTATGVFTGKLTDAQAYLDNGYILPVDTTIIAENDVLVAENKYQLVAEKAAQMTADGVFDAGGSVTADCPYCGTEDVQWAAFETRDGSGWIKLSGHYYLDKNTDYTTGIYGYQVAAGSAVCLHLNGQTLTQDNAKVDARTVWLSGGTLTIMGEGTFSGYGAKRSSDGKYNPAVDVCTGGTLNLCGGTYTHTNKAPIFGSRNGAATINIYNGTTIQGVQEYDFPSILFQTGTSGSLNLYGGQLLGGNNIAMETANAACNLNGGIVDGGISVIGNVPVSVSGAVQVGKLNGGLNLPAGTLLTVGSLRDGAQLYITADGAFTAELSNARELLESGKFLAADEEKTVTEENNILYVSDSTQ